MMGGGGSSNVKPLTREEMEKDTDNPFENPVSGVSAPSWKPDEVKKEKEEIEAQKAADKLKVDTAEVTPRASSSGSSGGAVARNIRVKRLTGKSGPTKAQRAAKARRNK
tara:strand:+ start:413 stop:739 length:327 start_codon:yes stop_codon:yes gene_type:complete